MNPFCRLLLHIELPPKKRYMYLNPPVGSEIWGPENHPKAILYVIYIHTYIYIYVYLEPQ